MTDKPNKSQKYDLEERTLSFAKACVDLCKNVPKNVINMPLVSQLIRSSSSVGANYREANDSITKKDFYHKIGICLRESKESKYWLELIRHADSRDSVAIEKLKDEAFQLTKIFATIGKNNDK